LHRTHGTGNLNELIQTYFAARQARAAGRNGYGRAFVMTRADRSG